MAQNNEAIPRTAFNKRAVKKVVFEKFLECTTAMMSRRRAEAQFDERSKLTQHFSGRKITFFSPSPPFFFSSKEYGHPIRAFLKHKYPNYFGRFGQFGQKRCDVLGFFASIKGAFNNYVDRILPFIDPPSPLCEQFLYPERG